MNLPETLCYPTPVCVSGAGFVWDNKAGILHKTSNAMSPLSSAEPYLCHREAWGEGRKMRAVKSVCEETTGSQIGSWLWGSQDDVWDPGFKTGMGLGISQQNWSDFRVINVMQWMRNRPKITIGIRRADWEKIFVKTRGLKNSYSIYYP